MAYLDLSLVSSASSSFLIWNKQTLSLKESGLCCTLVLGKLCPDDVGRNTVLPFSWIQVTCICWCLLVDPSPPPFSCMNNLTWIWHSHIFILQGSLGEEQESLSDLGLPLHQRCYELSAIIRVLWKGLWGWDLFSHNLSFCFCFFRNLATLSQNI